MENPLFGYTCIWDFKQYYTFMLIHKALLNKTNQANFACNVNLPKAKTSLFRNTRMIKYSMTSISVYLKQIQNAYLHYSYLSTTLHYMLISMHLL